MVGGEEFEFTPPMVVVVGEETSWARNNDEDCERGEYDEQIDLECVVECIMSSFSGGACGFPGMWLGVVRDDLFSGSCKLNESSVV